jgi:hypothetical protein
VEQWQLVGLITRRSVVRIHLPLPPNSDEARRQGRRAFRVVPAWCSSEYLSRSEEEKNVC